MSEQKLSRKPLRLIGFVLLGVVAVILGVRFAFARMLNTGGPPKGAVQKTATSKDGTIIAYEQTGTWPLIVLVAAALVDRDGTRPLARELAPNFTVINYDRRGRGISTDTQPYAVEREVEDLEVLVDASGGPAFLFGSSSGAVLALDATSRLGAKVRKLFMYEPPFIVDRSRPPITEDLFNQVTESLAAGRRNDAVTLFFNKGMGIPAIGVTMMRFLMPAWADMAGMAHTIPYDLKILAGTQSGNPLPVNRWATTTSPTLAAVGGKSEAFFHTGARGLTVTLPDAQYRNLEGLDHSAVLMHPQTLAAAMRQFFQAEK